MLTGAFYDINIQLDAWFIAGCIHGSAAGDLGERNGHLSYSGASQRTSHISHNPHPRSVIQVRIPNDKCDLMFLSLKAPPFRSEIHLDPLSPRRVRKLEATYKEIQILSQGEIKSRSLNKPKNIHSFIYFSNLWYRILLVAAIWFWKKGRRVPTMQLQHPTITAGSKVGFLKLNNCKF